MFSTLRYVIPLGADLNAPARGAELPQVIIATAAASLVTCVVVYIALGHRSGKVRFLGRLATFAERVGQMPGWSALPGTIATVSLLIALLGMYWDISLHIDDGRDPGPLANPAHYLILFGLFGIFIAGFFALSLPRTRPSTVALRLGPEWYAPLGAVLICACGAFSLIGFPLDDVWHRLFGQDVTLWGPTHLMLIGGAALSLFGVAILTVEGLRARPGGGFGDEPTLTIAMRKVALCGGILVGLSTFQAEFDFGVPQFQLLFQPMLIMLAAGVGLVTARLYAGRGGAIGAVLFFLATRLMLTVLVGPVFGETAPHFPLYIVEAILVEAVALRTGDLNSVRFGLWSGLLIGTAGLASEWAWSTAWMPIPWPAALFPEGAVVGVIAAVAGSLLGVWIGSHLDVEGGKGRPALRMAAIAAAVTLTGLVVFALYTPTKLGPKAEISLHGRTPGDDEARASIRVIPADAAANAEWFNVTAWQGGGRLVVDPLEEVGPGRYLTTRRIPVAGSWKTLIRLHKGRSLAAVPVYMPRDPAIPVGEIPARGHVTRPFRDEHLLLQREQTGGGTALVIAAYSTVVLVTLALIVLLVWGLHRLMVGGRAETRGSTAT